MEHDVCIAVMARAPVAGACKTRLIPLLGAEGAARLYAALLHDTLTCIDALPARRKVLLAAPEQDGERRLTAALPAGWELAPQVGDGLGPRLQHAFARLLAAHARVVVIGTDAPWAPYAAVRAWRDDPAELVLGPSADGGYYLVGLQRAAPALFDDVPFGTSEVYARTRQHAARLGLGVYTLPEAADVDEPDDLSRLAPMLAAAPERAPKTAAVLRQLFP